MELEQLIEVKKLLDKVTTGKVEYLIEIKEAHRIIKDFVEHKQVTTWKFTQE